jgi:hypothetical protein
MPHQLFRKIAIDHLLSYKRKNENLSGLDDGTYNYRGSLLTYPHILPWASRFANFLPEYQAELTAHIETASIKLHRYFHHLNSSQTICLNFFFPLELEKKLEWVLEYLGFSDGAVDYQTTCFEKGGIDGRVERNWRCTNFDYYFETTSGKRFYFEIKYTENRFGAKPENDRDEDAIEKFESVYLPLLKETVLPEHFDDPELFFDNYQILRNLVHLEANSYVVFIYPQGNHKIANDAENVKEKFLLPECFDNFFATTWEKIC